MKDLLFTTKEELQQNINVVIDYVDKHFKESTNENIKDLKNFNESVRGAIERITKLDFAITYQIGLGAKTKSFKRAIQEELKINDIATINYHFIIKSLNEKEMLENLLNDIIALIGALSGYNCFTNQGKNTTKNYQYICECLGLKTINKSDNATKPLYTIEKMPTIRLTHNQLKLEFKAPTKKEKAKKPSTKQQVLSLLEKSKDLNKQAILNELKKIFNI